MNLDKYLETFQSRTQPFIVVLGGTYRQPQQQFVVIERRALKVESLVCAVDVCYKAYQILHLDYAAQAAPIWKMLDTLIYGVKVNNEPGTVRAFRAYFSYTSSN